MLDELDPVAPRVEEIEKRPGRQFAARHLDEPPNLRAIVNDEAEMPAPIPGALRCSSPRWIKLMN